MSVVIVLTATKICKYADPAMTLRVAAGTGLRGWPHEESNGCRRDTSGYLSRCNWVRHGMGLQTKRKLR